MKKYIINILLIAFLSMQLPLYINASNFYYKTTLEEEGEVTARVLNVRTGPGTEYRIIKGLVYGSQVSIIGEIDQWYIVLLNDKTVGMVNKQYIKVTKIKDAITIEGDTDLEDLSLSNITNDDVGTLFSLTNVSRIENNLQPFIWDEKLNNIAQIKADDMSANDYFDHLSPTYGTPFKMLKEMQFPYKGASENLISNLSMEEAHLQLMASPSHRGNILSFRFNKMGVGIAESKKYGKIIVQIFVQEP